MGISGPIPNGNIFPAATAQPTPVGGIEVLTTDLAGWSNYVSAEENPDACRTVLDRMVRMDWATVCDTEDDARRLVGHQDLVFNKIVLMSKTRNDGTVKRHIMWDLRHSGVNQHVVLHERIVLPRLRDVALDLASLDAMSRLNKSLLPDLTCPMRFALYRCDKTSGVSPWHAPANGSTSAG